ncbi:MAG: hypothetical protein JW759_00075 [Candidatus Coatesbacteria bacterium]|nr:hypothetical protein [Candidatus Coatesbacteria bacterium]
MKDGSFIRALSSLILPTSSLSDGLQQMRLGSSVSDNKRRSCHYTHDQLNQTHRFLDRYNEAVPSSAEYNNDL